MALLFRDDQKTKTRSKLQYPIVKCPPQSQCIKWEKSSHRMKLPSYSAHLWSGSCCSSNMSQQWSVPSGHYISQALIQPSTEGQPRHKHGCTFTHKHKHTHSCCCDYWLCKNTQPGDQLRYDVMSLLITTSISSVFLHLFLILFLLVVLLALLIFSFFFCYFPLTLLHSSFVQLRASREQNVMEVKRGLSTSLSFPYNPVCLQCNPCYTSLCLSLLPREPLCPFCLWVCANVIPVRVIMTRRRREGEGWRPLLQQSINPFIV